MAAQVRSRLDALASVKAPLTKSESVRLGWGHKKTMISKPASFLTSVAAIMTSDLRWGNPGADVSSLADDPILGQLDQIPLKEGEHVTGVAVRDPDGCLFTEKPLSGDMLVASSTPIVDLFSVDWEKSNFLLVIHDADISGIVSPSDLNRPPVFSALFHVLADFEDQVSSILNKLPTTDERIACLGKEVNRWRNDFERLREAGFEVTLINVMSLACKLKLLKIEHCELEFDEDDISAISNLRNQVCHQNPLVRSTKEISSIKETLSLIAAIKGCLPNT